MKVLNNSDKFRERYAKRTLNVRGLAKMFGGGGAVGSTVAGASAFAVGHAAAGASLWSLGTSLPWVGAFCAGKATAVGIAAGTAALGSAAVLGPALLVGGGVAYAIYRTNRATLHKGSSASELANAFARVACLPMMALAVSICQADPASTEAVRDYVIKELGDWGYAEAYVRDGFEEAMRHSPEDLDGHYEWSIRQLESGSTEGIGATPVELPVKAVRGFADEFRNNLEKCIEQ